MRPCGYFQERGRTRRTGLEGCSYVGKMKKKVSYRSECAVGYYLRPFVKKYMQPTLNTWAIRVCLCNPFLGKHRGQWLVTPSGARDCCGWPLVRGGNWDISHSIPLWTRQVLTWTLYYTEKKNMGMPQRPWVASAAVPEAQGVGALLTSACTWAHLGCVRWHYANAVPVAGAGEASGAFGKSLAFSGRIRKVHWIHAKQLLAHISSHDLREREERGRCPSPVQPRWWPACPQGTGVSRGSVRNPGHAAQLEFGRDKVGRCPRQSCLF